MPSYKIKLKKIGIQVCLEKSSYWELSMKIVVNVANFQGQKA